MSERASGPEELLAIWLSSYADARYRKRVRRVAERLFDVVRPRLPRKAVVPILVEFDRLSVLPLDADRRDEIRRILGRFADDVAREAVRAARRDPDLTAAAALLVDVLVNGRDERIVIETEGDVERIRKWFGETIVVDHCLVTDAGAEDECRWIGRSGGPPRERIVRSDRGTVQNVRRNRT